MKIQFPARDKAQSEVQKINQKLEDILISWEKIKDFELRRQNYEQTIPLNKFKKMIEESKKELDDYITNNYPNMV